MSNIITKESIIEELYRLGVKSGDVLLITADLFNVGYFNKSKSQTVADWLEIFNKVVGENGCFIANANTKTFFRFKKNPSIVFERFAKTDVGALASAMVKIEDAVRSTHPTHSYIGLGHNVEKFLKNHTENSSSYEVIGNILEAGGKYLMIGTLDKKNAPQATHYVQEVLGITKHSPYKWLFQTYYKDEAGNLKIYTKKDYGGCSAGAYKLYGPLIVDNAIEIGRVGNTYGGLMDSAKSFDVIKGVLTKNRKAILCDDKNCTQCYGNYYYNTWRVIPFYIKKIFSLLFTDMKIKMGE